MELSLEKALVAKEELEKKVKRLESEVRKEKEEKERALRKEEIASAALAACSVPFFLLLLLLKRRRRRKHRRKRNMSLLSARLTSPELEKKIEQLNVETKF